MGTVGFRRPDNRQRGHELQGIADLLSVLSTLNQLHGDEAWNGRKLRQTAEPGERLGTPPLNVDQDIRVEQNHPSGAIPSLGGEPDLARECLAVLDLRASPD